MDTESIYVLDACAIIALLQDEPGADFVRQMLHKKDHRCLIHVINLCEVYYDLCRRADQSRADRLEAILHGYGLELDDSLSDLWKPAGTLKAEWRRVSLADCFALALAMRENATLVTTDHNELDPIAEADLCAIEFIR